jgi:hypothetical protein
MSNVDLSTSKHGEVFGEAPTHEIAVPRGVEANLIDAEPIRAIEQGVSQQLIDVIARKRIEPHAAGFAHWPKPSLQLDEATIDDEVGVSGAPFGRLESWPYRLPLRWVREFGVEVCGRNCVQLLHLPHRAGWCQIEKSFTSKT